MTQGTTGEGIGLEPFSEYQRRRRKAMGLDPLELYGYLWHYLIFYLNQAHQK